jgi:hypothetical protein
VAAGGGASVAGGGSVTTLRAIAVSVAVMPGIGVGMTKAVSVGVGATRVGVLVVSTSPELPDDIDWARSASRLDIKLVKATYRPSTMTNRTIKKPKA